ncbi:hypothetical protein D7I43_30665 [Micromonospora globbae]|jgi:hypothetical protein|uniref:DJ-1/PfpI domain-containing protein n=1 Tax=Micromonospora globbae TaxID=1894969 RepID=A0A420EQJ3_9ACTN|nr:hypothetical protein D7I43_30665 [Micromonospora globbae]
MAAFGTRVRVDQGWSLRSADVRVVPGGGFGQRDQPGIWAEFDSGVLPRAVARRPGLVISSLCTGAIILGRRG